MNKQSPIVSEFDTPEEAAAYDKWLHEKVAASLADERPPVPHDEVMARTQANIDSKKRQRKCWTSSGALPRSTTSNRS